MELIEQGTTYNCDVIDPQLFLALEFGVKSLPGVLFLILGTYRYCKIKHMAKSSVFYSRLFKLKASLSSGMAFFTLVYMITVFATPKDTVNSSWINQCDK